MSEATGLVAVIRSNVKLLVILLGEQDGPRAAFRGLKIDGIELPEKAQIELRDIMDYSAMEAAWDSALATERAHNPAFKLTKDWYPTAWKCGLVAEKYAGHTTRMYKAVDMILRDFDKAEGKGVRHGYKGFIMGVAHCCAENFIRGSPTDFSDWTDDVVEGTGMEFDVPVAQKE